MKNKLLLFLLAPAVLMAQENQQVAKTDYTPGRWYAGASYGLPGIHYAGSYSSVMGYGGYRFARHFAVQLGAFHQQNQYFGGKFATDPPYYSDGTLTATRSENMFAVPLWLRVSLLKPERRFNVYLLTGFTATWQSRREQYVVVAGGAALDQGSRQFYSTGLYYQVGLGAQARVWNRFFVTAELMPIAIRLSGNPNGNFPSLPYNLGIRYEFK